MDSVIQCHKMFNSPHVDLDLILLKFEQVLSEN